VARQVEDMHHALPHKLPLVELPDRHRLRQRSAAGMLILNS
jgi:hypothetical protein